MVRPRGIEPLLPGWKPGVLTTRRRPHNYSFICLFFYHSQTRNIISYLNLFVNYFFKIFFDFFLKVYWIINHNKKIYKKNIVNDIPKFLNKWEYKWFDTEIFTAWILFWQHSNKKKNRAVSKFLNHKFYIFYYIYKINKNNIYWFLKYIIFMLVKLFLNYETASPYTKLWIYY